MDMLVDGAKKVNLGKQILFYLIFAVIGIAVLIFSVNTIMDYNKKSETYKKVTGEVVDYELEEDDYDMKAIIAEYQVNGETYRATGNVYSNMPKSLGSKVELKYNPDNPKDVIWVNDGTNIIMPLVGGLFTLIGIAGIVSSIKKLRRKNDSSSFSPSPEELISESNNEMNQIPNSSSISENNTMESVPINEQVPIVANTAEQVPELLETNSQPTGSTIDSNANLFAMPTPIMENQVTHSPQIANIQPEEPMTPPPIIEQPVQVQPDMQIPEPVIPQTPVVEQPQVQPAQPTSLIGEIQTEPTQSDNGTGQNFNSL